MTRSTVLLTTLLVGLSGVGLSGTSALAQTDPDYGVEIQNNTVCSYITTTNVNVRSEPGTDSPAIAQLNAGDMVRAVRRDETGLWVKIAAQVYGESDKPEYVPLEGWIYNEYINGCSEPEFDRWRR